MRAFILFAGALALAACIGSETQHGAPAHDASAVAGSARDCFDAALVTDYEAEGANIIRLRAGPSAQYDVRVSGSACDSLDWSQQLLLESTSSSWICVGDQAGQGNISFRDVARGRRVSCYIDTVTRAPQS